MEISSTREAISTESTHETKTTDMRFPPFSSMSDNANLLDIERLGKEGRFLHYMVAKSAAAR
jgi:hypothetical protein